MGDHDLSEHCHSESHAAFRALPAQPWIARNLALIESRFAWIAFARGDLDAAERSASPRWSACAPSRRGQRAVRLCLRCADDAGVRGPARGELAAALASFRTRSGGSAEQRPMFCLVPHPPGRNAGCPRLGGPRPPGLRRSGSHLRAARHVMATALPPHRYRGRRRCETRSPTSFPGTNRGPRRVILARSRAGEPVGCGRRLTIPRNCGGARHRSAQPPPNRRGVFHDHAITV